MDTCSKASSAIVRQETLAGTTLTISVGVKYVTELRSDLEVFLKKALFCHGHDPLTSLVCTHSTNASLMQCFLDSTEIQDGFQKYFQT